MICQSSALQTKQTWDAGKPITLSGAVSGEPAPGSATNAYWSGLVLFKADDGPDANYVELATERHVPPDYGTTPRLMTLTLPQQPGGAYVGLGTPGRSYQFKISWNPITKQVTYSVDGVVVQTRLASLSGPVRVWTICVSVGAGTPNDGSVALCRFGPLTVTEG